MKRALYAGSFDPITRGHIDIVEQALKVFDEVIMAIGSNRAKTRTFTIEESLELIRYSISVRSEMRPKVWAKSFEGALVDFAAESHSDVIVRGLRQISDFPDEFVQHGVNTRLSSIPICYFICHSDYLHVSSSTAKMAASLGKRVDWLVDDHVERALLDHYGYITEVKQWDTQK